MDAGVGIGGQDDNGVGRRGLARQSSNANILNTSGTLERSFDVLNSSRVNALRATVDRHTDAVSRVLLSSKETLDRRVVIESAFRACRDAFIEVSTVLMSLLDGSASSAGILAGDIRKVVVRALTSRFTRRERRCQRRRRVCDGEILRIDRSLFGI